MTNFCTSIEQSKKLIELGIDINTADMCWSTANPDLEVLLAFPFTDADNTHDDKIPAWSLSALLGLMPTDDKKDEYYVDTESHSDYHTVSYRNCWDGCVHLEYSKESLLDAAFEMVCWLLEKKRL